MRLFLILAAIALIIGFIVYVVPTTFLFGALGWLILGVLFVVIDMLFGYVVPVGGRRVAA